MKAANLARRLAATAYVALCAVLAASAEPPSAAYAGVDSKTFAVIRADFYKAAASSDATKRSIATLEAAYPAAARPPIVVAYRAMLEGLLGKHDPNPAVKLAKVNAAIADYRGLVEAYPDSIEMRFLRYAFYSQLPSLFGVGKYVQPDLEALLSMYERGGDGLVPPRQLDDMAAWLLAEGKLKQGERERLEAAVAKLR